MYEKLENCPSCAHPKFNNYLICKDYSVSGESFALVKCANCELVFTNPRPSKKELSKYYSSDQYISHTNKSNTLVNLIYKIIRHFTLWRKVKLIKKYSRTGTILDYGCGTGHFLQSCKSAGFATTGVEPDMNARNQAKQRTGTSVIENVEDIPKTEKFDVITAWHVIEHVSDLRETLKHLRKHLTKDGCMIIAVPNVLSLDAAHYKEYWAAYDVPRHLYHFSPQAFKKLIKRAKLKLVDTRPMKFDAFYVSMLSEKYQHGRNNYWRAFLCGLKSNKSAVATGNYSSLIYILTKQ